MKSKMIWSVDTGFRFGTLSAVKKIVTINFNNYVALIFTFDLIQIILVAVDYAKDSGHTST